MAGIDVIHRDLKAENLVYDTKGGALNELQPPQPAVAAAVCPARLQAQMFVFAAFSTALESCSALPLFDAVVPRG